jgi:hypothetical protein
MAKNNGQLWRHYTTSETGLQASTDSVLGANVETSATVVNWGVYLANLG